MAEDIPKEYLKKDSIFNFDEAIEEFAFDFDDFMNNNFSKFIQSTFIDDFISFRRFYLERNYDKIGFYSHKFKGNFKLFISPHVYNKCEELQVAVQKGNVFIDKTYAEVVRRMIDFLKALIELANKIEKPINPKLLEKFWESNNLCNDYEDPKTKQYILTGESVIAIDSTSHNACCGIVGMDNCVIF